MLRSGERIRLTMFFQQEAGRESNIATYDTYPEMALVEDFFPGRRMMMMMMMMTMTMTMTMTMMCMNKHNNGGHNW